jgi:hypothetical protein
MRNDNKLGFGVAKVKDGLIKTGPNKQYGVKKEDVKLITDYGITGVVLSESLASSIDPKPEDPSKSVSPSFIDGIIKRVKATALGEGFALLMKLIVMVVGGQILALLIMAFIIWRFYTSLGTAGIVISF